MLATDRQIDRQRNRLKLASHYNNGDDEGLLQGRISQGVTVLGRSPRPTSLIGHQDKFFIIAQKKKLNTTTGWLGKYPDVNSVD